MDLLPLSVFFSRRQDEYPEIPRDQATQAQNLQVSQAYQRIRLQYQ